MSQGDLILDWISRARLYGLPRVTILVSDSEIRSQKTTVCEDFGTFYEIQFGASQPEI